MFSAQAIELDPNAAPYHVLLGELLQVDDDDAGAEAAFRRATELDAACEPAYEASAVPKSNFAGNMRRVRWTRCGRGRAGTAGADTPTPRDPSTRQHRGVSSLRTR